jgi:hypothetical protein
MTFLNFPVLKNACSLRTQALTQKRDGPVRAGRVLQPQNSKLDHEGHCRALLVSTAKAKASTVYFVRKCLGKLWEKDRREMVSSWRTTSVCHFAPLFYLAHCTQTPYSLHKLLESKFTHHTNVHTHTHGDYSHSLRSQITPPRRNFLADACCFLIVILESSNLFHGNRRK